ncbi:MAG: hypothetical protein V1676_01320 [Candidatus Diapherotrites archaeon]
MIPAKKRRVIYFFAVIYAVLIVALLYLLFFNAGLGAEETGEGGARAVYVVNTGSHLIRDITVSVREGGEPKELAGIAELAPGARTEIGGYDFFGTAGEKEIIIEAPFHQTFVKKIVVSTVGAPEIGYDVIFPTKVYAGVEFSFSLKLCNHGTKTLDFVVQERHDASVFGSEGEGKTTSVPAGGCKELQYSLTSAKAGPTTIYFNIKAGSISKEIEREIEVLE